MSAPLNLGEASMAFQFDGVRCDGLRLRFANYFFFAFS